MRQDFSFVHLPAGAVLNLVCEGICYIEAARMREDEASIARLTGKRRLFGLLRPPTREEAIAELRSGSSWCSYFPSQRGWGEHAALEALAAICSSSIQKGDGMIYISAADYEVVTRNANNWKVMEKA